MTPCVLQAITEPDGATDGAQVLKEEALEVDTAGLQVQSAPKFARGIHGAQCRDF